MVADTVISVISKIKRVPEEQISLESTFEDLNIDSLDGVEIVCELEERLKIEIPDEVAQDMRSVGQVIESLRGIVSDDADGAAATA